MVNQTITQPKMKKETSFSCQISFEGIFWPISRTIENDIRIWKNAQWKLRNFTA